MSVICLKPKGSCPGCNHYRYDHEKGCMACFASKDMDEKESAEEKKKEMIDVIIVIENGMLQTVFSKNENINIELLDLDSQREDEIKDNQQRLQEIKKNKNFKEVY